MAFVSSAECVFCNKCEGGMQRQRKIIFIYIKKPAKLEMSSSLLPITLPFFSYDVIEIQYKICSIECREDGRKTTRCINRIQKSLLIK